MTIHLCVDRILPGQYTSSLYQPPTMGADEGEARAAALVAKLWQGRPTLRIRFLDGETALQRKVAQFAAEWTAYANLELRFDNDPKAEIRISFRQPGSWSLVGIDALEPAIANQPTMNFGWLRSNTPNDEVRRVVLHEFGHALGLVHEHQNPAVAIPWNKAAVYQYYQGPPNQWSKEQVDLNIFEVYGKGLTKYSRFDRNSIMLYPIPSELTTGGYQVGWNNELSYWDKLFIRKCYPPTKQHYPRAKRQNRKTASNNPAQTTP